MGNPIVFIILAVIAVLSGIGMLTSKNAVHSALYLVLNFITIAIFYIVLNAPFIAMVQVTVYAGAIVVLFLFVIMLLGAEKLKGLGGQVSNWHGMISAVLALTLIATLLTQLRIDAPVAASLDSFDSSPEAIGLRLFESFLLPFELTSLLLLSAMISLVIWKSAKGKKEIVA